MTSAANEGWTGSYWFLIRSRLFSRLHYFSSFISLYLNRNIILSIRLPIVFRVWPRALLSVGLFDCFGFGRQGSREAELSLIIKPMSSVLRWCWFRPEWMPSFREKT